jgi:hypothetical protein
MPQLLQQENDSHAITPCVPLTSHDGAESPYRSLDWCAGSQCCPLANGAAVDEAALAVIGEELVQVVARRVNVGPVKHLAERQMLVRRGAEFTARSW